MIVEEWRDIKGFEGTYQVSSLGNVKRIKETASGRKGKILKPQKVCGSSSSNYLVVKLYDKPAAKGKTTYIHRLVAEAFLDGPTCCPCCKVKYEVNHKDENGMNNQKGNLEFCTRQENIDKSKKKTQKASGKKLNEYLVKGILTQIRKGISDSEIARKYKVAPSTICNIKKKRLWAHVEIDESTYPVEGVPAP